MWNRIPKVISLEGVTAVHGAIVIFTVAVPVVSVLTRTPMEMVLSIWFSEIDANRLVDGMFETIRIGSISVVLGTISGFVIAYMMRPLINAQTSAWIGVVAKTILYSALGLPVFLLLIYFQSWARDAQYVTIGVLSFNLAVFVARLVFTSFAVLPLAQLEAGYAIGARPLARWWLYELPAVRRICGAGITNEWATTLKLSSLAGTIGTYDILKNARMLVDVNFDLRPFLVVAIFYVVLTVPLFWAADLMGRSFRG